jgi:hypothetical protein
LGTHVFKEECESGMTLFPLPYMNLRFEWLEKGVKEIGNSNWFPSKLRYSSEVKLARLGLILPIKWLFVSDNFRSDVMLKKDEGSCPTKLFWDRSNSSNFLSLDHPEKLGKNTLGFD